MQRYIYQALKIAVGTVLATAIGQWMGLNYATTAGIIALLSILDTRKQTYRIGLKRIVIAFAAILLATTVFGFLGHSLWALGLFLIIFVPSLTWLNSTEGLSISTVLVTHIYTIDRLSMDVVLNEMGIMIIGVAVAFLLNFHMMNMVSGIQMRQKRAEKLISEVLTKMSYQLLNQCSIEEPSDLLRDLNEVISDGLKDAITYDNNYILKDYSYYAHYFRMRREQYFLLQSMERYFTSMFISVEEAKLLSEFTRKVADELNEFNDGSGAMEELERLRDHYKKMPLPSTRDAFEDRATLFAYMNDLSYFIEIKSVFMNAYGEIQYC